MESRQWDIFCKVIDNLGDIGVSWRLAADLASRGHRVRLWADDSAALAWMAPDGCERVRVMPWGENVDTACLTDAPCDVLVETFGCEVAPEFIAACARIHSATRDNCLYFQFPVWINLEYLTAELYAARSHGLPSLVQTGPAAGWKKWFFYPGFAENNGGLLREPGLLQRQSAFDRAGWLSRFEVNDDGQTVVFLFCYEPAALAQLIGQLGQQNTKKPNSKRITLLVAAGRTAKAVAAALSKVGLQPNIYERKQLSNLIQVVYLPELSQLDFDHALWAADINFVRGEDSLVRAIWAGKPWVWQIYAQADGAHWPKLEALLSLANAPPSQRAFHRCWNGCEESPLLPPLWDDLAAWHAGAQRLGSAQGKLGDLTSQLEQFALKHR